LAKGCVYTRETLPKTKFSKTNLKKYIQAEKTLYALVCVIVVVKEEQQ
jgi:hypothetical protein